MLLKEARATCHTELVLTHNKDCVAERLASPAQAVTVGHDNDIVEAVASNLC